MLGGPSLAHFTICCYLIWKLQYKYSTNCAIEEVGDCLGIGDVR